MRLIVDEPPVEHAHALIDAVPKQKASVHEGYLGVFDGKERSIQEHDAGHGNSRGVIQQNQA
jgi:hypothetical protein